MPLSVAEPLRHKGRLEVHVKAQFLATYTAQILKNEKIFDPNVDVALIDRMRTCASKGDGYMMLRNMDRYYCGLWR